MKTLLTLSALSAFAALSMGCTDMAKHEEGPANADAILKTCQDEEGSYDWFIGKSLDDVRDYFPVDDRKFGTREPGFLYTQEYVFGRTLVHLDEEGVIERVRCG